ncbi:MAG TPA: TIGR03619 family F420-dependent LLM class oxidoreductase, partial [Acidimicrobiales bacterium]|nr:TIGR03619 family F420-dependent LLM class oxidoreductase [Acidimicrobiales bacterium]
MSRPQEVVDLAVQAESAGAASLWVSHHVLHRGFVSERLGTRPYYDPLIMLAALAGATARARIGTSVLVLPYLHPMPTAKMAATIDHLSAGRLDLGVGVGGLREEHDAIAQVPFGERGAYSDEFLEVLVLLWAGRTASFSGRYFDFDEVEAHPGPFSATGIPILVGGHGAAARRRAGRFGSGWHAIGLEPEQVPAERRAVSAAFEAAGRSLDGAFQVRLHIPIDDLDLDGWRRRVDAYEGAGVTDLLLAPQSGDPDQHRHWLDRVL